MYSRGGICEEESEKDQKVKKEELMLDYADISKTLIILRLFTLSH